MLIFTRPALPGHLPRDGKVRSDLFRFNGHWKGLPCIRGNLLHDFQALNKLELGVFDYWDELHTKADSALTVDEKLVLDQIADITIDPDSHFDQIQELFQNHAPHKTYLCKTTPVGDIG